MEDLIKRKDALKELRLDHKDVIYIDKNECARRIKAIPSADAVSVVQGEWIEDYNNTYLRRRMKCSVCGKFSGIGGIKSNQLKPYCPNCGARMKGADDGE